jgi:chromosome segregation ATPase
MQLKEVGRRAKLNQDAPDHVASDLSAELRKLKQAYETLSSKKDKELSALLSEKDSLRSQLDVMQQDYAKLLKNKEVEAAQATEAALKLQQSVDELKVLAQKKDDEIGKLQEEAVGAKKQLMKMQSLVKEKDDEIQRLKGWHPQYFQMSNKDINGTHKKLRSDDPCVRGKSKTNVGNYGQDETSQKRRRVSSLSNVIIMFPVTWSYSH